MEHPGDEASTRLLSVHTDSESFYASQKEERVEGGKTVTDGVDHEGHMLCEVVSVAHDHSSHKVMMSRQVLGRAIVNDVRAVFQWALEVWAHHRVIDHHNRIRSSFLDLGADLGDVDDLEERVGRGLEQNHGDLGSQVRNDRRWVGGVDMVNGYAVVVPKIVEQTIGTTVEVIPSDY